MLAVFLMLGLVFLFTACGQGDASNSDGMESDVESDVEADVERAAEEKAGAGKEGSDRGGSGQGEDGPDLTYFDNGYGTFFVLGRRIEHPADTSTSIVVDWRHEKAARASDHLKVREERGIVYSHSQYADGRDEGKPLDLHLNLMVPEDGNPGKKQETTNGYKGSPVILLVPGGGFMTCRINDKYMGVQRYLAAHGYAVAIMQYRVIGQGRYADAADDVRSAVTWIREQGREYGLDPDRISLMGNSAGGYVAALALCQGIPEKDDSDPAKTGRKKSPIRCMVNFYGLSDILNNKADYEDAAIQAEYEPHSSDSQFVNGATSGKGLMDDKEEAKKADPSTYIDGDEPPFLHMHGDADLWVSPSQSLHLHEALTKAGVPSTRYSAIGAGHADKAFRTKAALDIVIDFLDRYNS